MKLTVGMITAAFVFSAAAAIASARDASSSLGSSNLRINPDLKPKSDAKFFGKDYPDDIRPPLYAHDKWLTGAKGKHFAYPYPEIQDSDRYDKDYVKDENDDQGHWKAQMDYDTAKNKLGKERRELEEALANAAKRQAELQKAWDDYQRALEKEAAAHKKEVGTDAEHDKAKADLEELKKNIKNEADEVELEITDLEDCKKKLIAAKAELKKMMKEQDEAMNHEDARQKKEDGLEVIEKEMKKKEDQAEKKEKEEDHEHDVALKSYEEEKADVERLEAALEKAAEVLRKYRRQADPDGGVYQVKSGVPHAGLTISAMLAALVAVA